MSVGTQFASPLEFNAGTVPKAYGPFTYDECLSIDVRIVQIQTHLGEGAVAGACVVATPEKPLDKPTATAGRSWEVPLALLSRMPFQAGSAQASAAAVVRDQGVERIVEWSHAVELR